MAQALIGISAQSPLPVPWVRATVILTQNVQTLSYADRTTVETSTHMQKLLRIVVFHLGSPGERLQLPLELDLEMAQALIGLSALPPHPVPWVRVIVILTQNVQTLSYAGRTTVETSTQELNLLQIVVFYPLEMELAQALIGISALSPLPVPWVTVIVILTQNVHTLSYAGRTTVKTST